MALFRYEARGRGGEKPMPRSKMCQTLVLDRILTEYARRVSLRWTATGACFQGFAQSRGSALGVCEAAQASKQIIGQVHLKEDGKPSSPTLSTSFYKRLLIIGRRRSANP